MAWWRIGIYQTENGVEPMDLWYACLDSDLQTQIDILIRELAQTDDWYTDGHAKELERQHAGLTQLCLEVEYVARTPRGKREIKRRQYRLPGLKLSNPTRDADGELIPGVFVILLGCQKGRGRTIPPGAFDWAMRLACELLQDKGVINEYPR